MKGRLRVLAVSDFYRPRAGGVERVVHETARRLAGHGVEVEVLTRRLSAEAPGFEVDEGITVHRVGMGPRALAVERWQIGRAVSAWVKGELGRFDVVHAHLTLLALPLLAPLRRLGIPLVATFYGPWHREYEAEMSDPAVPSRWPPWLRGLVRAPIAASLKRAQARVLAQARLRIVLSEHSRRELREEFGYTDRDSVVRIAGGVDVGRFHPRDRREARARLGLEHLGSPLLVSVRRLVPRMGLEVLVDAAAALTRSGDFPELGLVIGGSGPLGPGLAERAAQAGIGPRVRMLGRVEEADLSWLYAAADVVVIPSRALEGFGLPVLEAWAAGVPVVATPVGALAETVGELDPCLLARGMGAGDLADAIVAALRLPAAPLAERARGLAESYDWEVSAGQLAAAYGSVARVAGRRVVG